MPPLMTAEAWAAISASYPLFRAAAYLKLLHKVHQPRIDKLREQRMARVELAARIAMCAEGGQVLVIESGRDCDGVEYDGRCHTIDATRAAFDDLDARLGDWADGPYSLSVARPSQAASVRYESRDLVAEAHENGHPHVIVSRFA